MKCRSPNVPHQFAGLERAEAGVSPGLYSLLRCHRVVPGSKCRLIWGQNFKRLYRVRQNHGKQVLRISCIEFHLTKFQFVVIPHGKRDLSSLPWTGEAAVQIS